MGATTGESGRQVQRYIRLTELVPEVLQMVDAGNIAFRPAVEISYLPKEEQQALLETMDCEDCTPSLAQAIKMKQFSQHVLTLWVNSPRPFRPLRLQLRKLHRRDEHALRNILFSHSIFHGVDLCLFLCFCAFLIFRLLTIFLALEVILVQPVLSFFFFTKLFFSFLGKLLNKVWVNELPDKVKEYPHLL